MVTPDDYWTLMIEKPTLTPSRQRKLDNLERYLKEKWAFTKKPLDYIQAYYEWSKEQWIIKMSLEQLRVFLLDKWIQYKTAEWLRQLLNDLGITRREKWEKTESGWVNSWHNSHNIELAETNLRTFRDAVMNIISEEKETNGVLFDEKEYKLLSFWIDKALFLLKLKPKDIWSIQNLTGLRKLAICNSINSLLWEVCEWIKKDQWITIIPPTIQKWSIWNLLKKVDNQDKK